MEQPITSDAEYYDRSDADVDAVLVHSIWIDEDGETQLRIEEGEQFTAFDRHVLGNCERRTVDKDTFVERVEDGELERVTDT